MSDLIYNAGELYETGEWFYAQVATDEGVTRMRLQEHFKNISRTTGAVFGEISFEVLEPDNARCPEPPDRDMKFLAAWAEVVGLGIGDDVEEAAFVQDLNEKDLVEMRKSTREAHQLNRPNEPRLSDEECDAIIGKIGLGMVERSLRNVKGTA